MRRFRPRLEELESREVLAVWGVPWTNPGNISVSFTPDGTSLGPDVVMMDGSTTHAQSSNMNAVLGATMTQTAWRGEILRALQTWATVTNINFSLKTDSGAQFGIAGASQGDSRFGDLRIGGTALSDGTVAISQPFNPAVGTLAGDIFLDTTDAFQIGEGSGYDLYSVVLQEVGHTLGVPGQLTDQNSPMYDYYMGVRTGLTDPDIAAVQNLYGGARRSDLFEGSTGNGTIALATSFSDAALSSFLNTGQQLPPVVTSLTVGADVTTASDVDVYRYQTTSTAPGFQVRLSTNSVSLLAARLTVLNAQGQTLASNIIANPGGNDVLLHIGGKPNEQYFFKVEALPGSPFAVGAYTLTLIPDNPQPLNDFASAWQQQTSLDNPVLQSATDLQPLQPTATQRSFAVDGQFLDQGATQAYKVTLTADQTALNRSLSVTLSPQVTGTPGLTLQVLNSVGQVVASPVAGEGGVSTVQLDHLQAGATYYFAVSGAPVAYTLSIQETVTLFNPPQVEQGTLSAVENQQFRGIVMPQAGVVHVSVTTQAPLAGEAAVALALFDMGGRMVYSQTVTAGQSVSANLFLNKGAYTWRLIGGMADGSPLANIGYQIKSELLSDPIGPQLVPPLGAPPPRDLDPDWYSWGFFQLFGYWDPYGRATGNGSNTPIVIAPP